MNSPETRKTRREALTDALIDAWRTPRDLAGELRIRLRDIGDELEHVRRSVGKRFRVRPAECTACGFVFRDRKRTTTPSRCPTCRSERIEGPWFSVHSD